MSFFFNVFITMAIEKKDNLEPRISVLEAATETLGRELIQLSTSVREQGVQLTKAIGDLAVTQNQSYNSLSDKIANFGRTDWTTFWTMMGSILLLLGAISTPVWLNFNAIDKQEQKVEKRLDKHDDLILEGLKERAQLREKIEMLEKLEQRSNGNTQVR